MECQIRKWNMEDAADIAAVLNNRKIQDTLRDGLPYPYTVKDAEDFIHAMLQADEHTTYAFAITLDDTAVGSIGVFRKDNIHAQTAEMGYYLAEGHGEKGLEPALLSRPVNTFLNTPISFGFLQNPLPTTQLHAAFLKKVDFCVKACSDAMQ